MHRAEDRLLRVFAVTSAIGCASIVLLIFGFLTHAAAPVWGELGWARFFTDPSWHPLEGRFHLAPMLVASLLATSGAVAVATPLGIASAFFSRVYAPRGFAAPYRRLLELLSGIPSVVYGFWGIVTLVPLLSQWQPPGASLLAGVLILAVMILPTIALLSDAALAAVPREAVAGAAALGLDRWSTLRRVVLPAARPGLLTGVLLATGRAVGETMAVLMVCGNVVQIPGSVFEPVRTLTANIALEMGYALEIHQAALFATGLVLWGLAALLVLAAERVSGGGTHG